MKTDRSFIVTNQGAMALLRHPMTMMQSKVFWHLIITLPPSGEIVSKADLEAKLGITRPRITLTMKQFCEKGFLLRGVKVGLSYHYKVNPAFIRYVQ